MNSSEGLTWNPFYKWLEYFDISDHACIISYLSYKINSIVIFIIIIQLSNWFIIMVKFTENGMQVIPL